MKYLIAVMLLVLFSVSTVYALDEYLRCDDAHICDFGWDVPNKTNAQNTLISTPCNVTVSNATKDYVWSVLSGVKNTWHNVTMPVKHLTSNFGGGWYKARRNCSGAISSFNFMPNITLETYMQGNITIDANVSVDVTGIADIVWNYTGSYAPNSTGYILQSTSSSDDYFAIVISLMIIAFSFFFMAVKLREKHPALQVGLILFGIFTILANINIMMIISDSDSGVVSTLTGVYTGLMWITILLIFYAVLWYFITALIQFGKDKRKQKEFMDTF